MKQCSKCKLYKITSLFNKDKKIRSGLRSICKECSKDSVRELRKNIEYRKRQVIWNEKWRKNNPEKVLAIRVRSENKRRTLLASSGNYTNDEWEEKKIEFNYQCAICGIHDSVKKLTVDHIIPISKYGSNEIKNIQPLCINCNSQKNNR